MGASDVENARGRRRMAWSEGRGWSGWRNSAEGGDEKANEDLVKREAAINTSSEEAASINNAGDIQPSKGAVSIQSTQAAGFN